MQTLLPSIYNHSYSVFDAEKILVSRPHSDARVFDYASLLNYSTENLEEMLRYFEKQYGVELVIVTVPKVTSIGVSQFATTMLSNWNLGRHQDGRGILMLLSNKEKKIKIEVGYGGEHVFTDLFCGYIERKQLKTYFENQQVDEGLTATLEEFIGRAEGQLSDDEIRRKMKGELSGGAGLERKVSIGNRVQKGPALSSPTPGVRGAASAEELYE